MMGLQINTEEIDAVLSQNEDVEGVIIFRDGERVYLSHSDPAPGVEFDSYTIRNGTARVNWRKAS
ncbi:hypothetical protein [Mesorhizobium sp. M0058]|uniref:hypothetical protein n=1 Tax=Mesorhizobium sp. M0058 TaxID=2956865 RepID=UPI00333B7743